MLDAGAGRAQYRGLFAHAHYETADFLAVKGKKYARPDYVCDLAAIPVADARFDHVVCTQVLEHLPEPQRVIEELGRVLKPGGTLWLSAPLFYAEHERPYDFFRYTRFGLRQLLEGARLRGARDRVARGLLRHAQLPGARGRPGAPAGAGRLRRRRGGRRSPAPPGSPAARRPGVADVLAGLDERHKVIDAGLPKNHTVVARKPLGDDPGTRRVPGAPGG